MSIPYYSSSLELFGFPIATGDTYIEYPFIEQGDTETKIYHIACSIRKQAYHPKNIYRFTVSGISDSGGTSIGNVSMAWDGVSVSDNAPIYRDSGNNYEFARYAGSGWFFYEQNTFDPFVLQTSDTGARFPFEATNYSTVTGSGTLAFITTNKIPDLNDTLIDSNARIYPTLPENFTDVNAYFVGDFNHRVDESGELLTFDRQFANIPQDRSEPSGSEIFTFPGLQSVAGTGSSFVINSVSQATPTELSIITSGAHGISVNDSVKILMRISVATSGGGTYSEYRIFYAEALTGTGLVTLRVKAKFPENFSYIAASGKVYPGAKRGRSQISQIGTTETRHSYFLPGVTTGISNIQDIPLAQKFEGTNYSTGAQVTFLTSSTEPTADEYREFIENGDLLTLSSDIRRWKGNIYEVITKGIRAL